MNDSKATQPPGDTNAAVLAGLEELAGYLPQFLEPDFHFGDPPAPVNGKFYIGDYFYSDTVYDFIAAAYDKEVIQWDFDWPKWMQTAEARRLRDDPERMAQATPLQLARLLTIVIRQDRYVSGALMTAFRSGLLIGILRRAQVLTSHDAPEPGQLSMFWMCD